MHLPTNFAEFLSFGLDSFYNGIIKRMIVFEELVSNRPMKYERDISLKWLLITLNSYPKLSLSQCIYFGQFLKRVFKPFKFKI